MFVSYAQNFEDLMLWRALSHIEAGFYVDVGAQDPIVDSVSLAFYERGWRGVHIEPIPDYADRLRKHRADETVLELAISNVSGQREIFEFQGTGLSTFSEEHASRHRTQRAQDFARRTVETSPLDQALEAFRDRPIHWLKIDVEGAELEVVEGWDGKAIRPWIIVIESTKPLQRQETYESWEPLVLAKGYHFCYFDGLNRFYIANEHPELNDSFRAPPNVFDDFVPAALVRERSECERLRVEVAEARRAAVLADERVQEVEKLASDVIASAREVEEKFRRDAQEQRLGVGGEQHGLTELPRLANIKNSYRLLSEDDFATMILRESC